MKKTKEKVLNPSLDEAITKVLNFVKLEPIVMNSVNGLTRKNTEFFQDERGKVLLGYPIYGIGLGFQAVGNCHTSVIREVFIVPERKLLVFYTIKDELYSDDYALEQRLTKRVFSIEQTISEHERKEILDKLNRKLNYQQEFLQALDNKLSSL